MRGEDYDDKAIRQSNCPAMPQLWSASRFELRENALFTTRTPPNGPGVVLYWHGTYCKGVPRAEAFQYGRE